MAEALTISKLINKSKRSLSVGLLTAVVVLFIYSSFLHNDINYNCREFRYLCYGKDQPFIPDMKFIDRIIFQKKPYNFLNPPQLRPSDLGASSENNVSLSLKELSELVHSQIKELQDSKNCGKGSILCSHFNMCGLGCQIHHRAACLMLSYAMGLPLIHETELKGVKWAYSTPWTDVMFPLGSSCNVSSSTYNWTWKHTYEFYLKPQRNLEFFWKPEDALHSDKLDFPMFDGIVVPSSLAEMVERLHPEPFQWWANQFVQYVWQLQPHILEKIRQDQDSIGLQSDCIAFHVRRTDKKREANGSMHELDEYFSKAKEVYDEISKNGGKMPQVFIASDDSAVLPASKKKFKDWDVVGFNSKKTLKTQKERNRFLYEILRDTVTMAQCETIVCAFSSNICCLLLELTPNEGLKRIISLDGTYRYIVWGATLKSVNKIDFKVETVV